MAGVGAPLQAAYAVPGAVGADDSRCKTAFASLVGRQLQDATVLLDMLGVGLKNAFLVFSRHGLMVHSSVCGEQVYVGVPSDRFTEFHWNPANGDAHLVFLANVDSKRGLLDAFRLDKKRTVKHVVFTLTHGSPNCVLEQRVYYRRDGEPDDSYALVKHEFTNYSIMVPGATPDFTATFTRPQLAKLQAVSRPGAESVTFELARGGGLTVTSTTAQVGFTPVFDPAREPQTSAQILDEARASVKRSNARLLACSGQVSSFKISLESTPGFRTILQKLRHAGGDVVLRFFLSPQDACMLSVSSGTPVGLTMFLFCSRTPFFLAPPAGPAGPAAGKRERGLIETLFSAAPSPTRKKKRPDAASDVAGV
ncbi:DNA polymerase processivity subunit [Beluga whale alphaherpesvirus 1]|uniref:DNA polymerase processivity factor n=1 Tax=Beluga whale alphaherpesvirus 1 TaxID=1434720 RepID=A0A286RUI5_9ALPH|nr:DNA polymerase processivity subunit [Beluga whale alphaherpesvirus 1]ASW27064.1 DNA polymerase processivity subunit [Beluga whale alphaherpesvirus 1]